MVEENELGLFIHGYLQYYGQILGHTLLGLILNFLMFICFFYWKGLLIYYLKHRVNPDAGYLPILQELRKNKRNMLFFTAVVSSIYMTVGGLSKKFPYIMTYGSIGFSIIYIGYYLYTYLIKKEEFDYFEDWIFIYKLFFKTKSLREKYKKA